MCRMRALVYSRERSQLGFVGRKGCVHLHSFDLRSCRIPSPTSTVRDTIWDALFFFTAPCDANTGRRQRPGRVVRFQKTKTNVGKRRASATEKPAAPFGPTCHRLCGDIFCLRSKGSSPYERMVVGRMSLLARAGERFDHPFHRAHVDMRSSCHHATNVMPSPHE